MLWGRVHGVSRSCGARVGRVFGHVGGARGCVRAAACCWGSETARAWGKQVEGRRLTNDLRPSPRVRPRARGCLLVW